MKKSDILRIFVKNKHKSIKEDLSSKRRTNGNSTFTRYSTYEVFLTQRINELNIVYCDVNMPNAIKE